MNLAYVTDRFPGPHGERFLEGEVRALSAYCDVTVLPSRPEGKASPGGGGAAAREFLLRPFTALRSYFEVAFARGTFGARGRNLRAVTRALGLARHVRESGVEHLHAVGAGVPGTVAYMLSRMTGVPYSLSVHQRTFDTDGLTVRKFRAATFARTISQQTCLDVQTLVPLAAPQCHVIRSGVVVPECAPEPALRRVPRILVAGGNPVNVLRSLETLRERGLPFACDIVQEDGSGTRIVRLIEAHRLRGFVRLLGAVSFEDVRVALAGSEYDLFVLSNDKSDAELEDIPLLALQAMASAVAVVATEGARLDEVIDAGSGFLVAHDDQDALTGVLERLVADSGLRNRTGARGRERVFNAFEIDRTTRQLAERFYGASQWVQVPLSARRRER